MGSGLYEDIIEKSGAAANLTGKAAWAGAFIDYDNDGDQDIISANGTAEELILQPPLLLENDGKGYFRNTGPEHGKYFSSKRSGRGLATIDFDNDGDKDVIISHVDLQETAALLRNDGGNMNHWIGIALEGKDGVISAVGARVTIFTGMKRQVFINQWATGYLSNSDPRILIGIDHAPIIDTIEVIWNNGNKEVFNNIKADRYIKIREGKGIETLK
jgi:hypothetical protein